MRLYHFTEAARCLPIKERGLSPGCDDTMSPDHPVVVWLTAQPDVSLTADEGRSLCKRALAYEAPLSEHPHGPIPGRNLPRGLTASALPTPGPFLALAIPTSPRTA
jgi:hypothetical protein